ncbi:MAG TPA: GGDEF domain-containing protein [Burkholderiales bacterium]|nr:GGDEF domain-containing protein [Burkholderiales bacterium]
MTKDVSKVEFDRCLDTVVDLTRYQSPQAITTALHDTLRNLIPAQRLRLFAISNNNRDVEFNEQNTPSAVVRDLFDPTQTKSLSINNDMDLVRCIQARNRVQGHKDGQDRLVIPVFGALDIWALLVVEGINDVSKQNDMLARLLRVYSNQMHMLSRSEVDPLTGLYNRQSFYERLSLIASRTAPRRRAADARVNEVSTHCFTLLDIDHFKQVNDQFGHPYGDEVLVELARMITRSFRHDDMLFRYGGEEFAAVLVNIDLESATRVLERFRGIVEAYTFPGIGHKTVSIGYTMIDAQMDIQRIVRCADKALYYAKNHGRNRSDCYEKLVAAGELDAVASAETDIQLF